MKEIKPENIERRSFDIFDKGTSHLSSVPVSDKIDLKRHWDNAYINSPQEKLGWYETDLSATLQLIEKVKLAKEARMLIIGAGSTTLVDELVNRGFSNIIASDISEVALNNLRDRVGESKVEFIIDDLTNSTKLYSIDPVDLWIDRAVLHFFTEKNDQDAYFSLFKKKVKKRGFALIAQFNLQGAEKCSGLPVYRYSKEMLEDKLGSDYKIIDSFDYLYTMPSGEHRPYIYTLFKRV
jgi:hypothetical protein